MIPAHIHKAVVLIWDAVNEKWDEETWAYPHYTYLFRQLARKHRLEKRICVLKNTRLLNLWNEWVKKPMTATDRRRLEKAKRMQFADFTERFISLFRTDEAFARLDGIMRDIYLKEEARTGSE